MSAPRSSTGLVLAIPTIAHTSIRGIAAQAKGRCEPVRLRADNCCRSSCGFGLSGRHADDDYVYQEIGCQPVAVRKIVHDVPEQGCGYTPMHYIVRDQQGVAEGV